jgi:hypothetical protein
MRNQQRIWATIFVLILVHSAEAQSRGQREALEHGWLSNYRAAKDEAKRSGRPIMLVFRCVP